MLQESDEARHKCLSERRKPVSDQAGSMQCESCGRWFRSRGGLAVHRCRGPEELEPKEQQQPREKWCVASVGGLLGDSKCLLERSKPVEQQKGSVLCTQCHRWLRSAGGLGVHKKTCRSSSGNSFLPRKDT